LDFCDPSHTAVMKIYQSIHHNRHDDSKERDAFISHSTTYGDAEAAQNYQSIQLDIHQDNHDESSEGDTPVNLQRSSSYKRYLVLGVVAFGFLLVLLTYNLQGDSQKIASNNADAAALLLKSEVDNLSVSNVGEDDISFSNGEDDDDSVMPVNFTNPLDWYDYFIPNGIDYEGTIDGDDDADDDYQVEPNFFGCSKNEECADGLFCCKSRCRRCCANNDCLGKRTDFPPPGEFGEALCVRNRCQTYLNGKSSEIPADGYPVWLASETSDHPNVFQELKMPRTVYNDGGPLMEQVWRIDFNKQDASFEKDAKVVYNGTHITISSFQSIQTSYSRSYNWLNESETGVNELIMFDNEFSVVADYPKVAFAEKYHTLTFDGKKEKIQRGDYIKEKAKWQFENLPKFSKHKWFSRAYPKAVQIMALGVIYQQVEAGLDKALAWQIRRFVDTYPKNDFGSVNPSTSASWASHSKKAKQAIEYAEDPSFKRDYLKSETHCKHFEQLDGVSYTKDSVTFPMDRPITTYTGEMVMTPVHYLGLGIGHTTLYYDPETNVLEMFYQTFSHSRQHSDVKFPGPYSKKGNALYVSPVADGKEYEVDPDRDGRMDSYFKANGIGPYVGLPGKPDFRIWELPTNETCFEKYRDGDFWDKIDGTKQVYGNLWQYISQTKQVLAGVVGGMPCVGSYMANDYGGGNGFDAEEIGLWAHSLIEIPKRRTKEMVLADFWDGWECFYRKNC